MTDGGGITLRSSAFSDHDFIPSRYARAGEDRPPPLEWTDPPDGTSEFALLCEDPDAPGGSFTHWIVTGIPATTRSIDDELPAGATAGRNDFGAPGWGGPHPPAGDPPHRYVFRLLAVDTHLALPRRPTAADVWKAADGHTLATGTLVGLFGR